MARDVERGNSGDQDTEQHTFTYGYDLNGNLSSIDDASSGARADHYALGYTDLNEVTKVTESKDGQETRATSYTWDPDGQAETVTSPGEFSRYTYDLREKVHTVSVGTSQDDPNPKVSTYTYDAQGRISHEVKGNGNTADNTYYADGSVHTTTGKRGDGTLVASHTYAYDPNGNQAQDVSKKMNADDHSAYLASTTDYTYDPADQVVKSVKTGNGPSTDTYVYDNNANVVSQDVGGVPSSFTYDRNRLQTSTANGSTSDFTYDPFGRQESVSKNGKVVQSNVYDGFDHVVESQQRRPDDTMKSTTYTFDPLDRTASMTADGKTTDYTYAGLSDNVLSEEVAGQQTKSYQYSPWGQRLSQITHKGDGSTEDAYYGYNSHTDVETLTDDSGNTKATYGYKAYGADDTSEFTGIDKPDATNPDKEPYNSYRYNAKRWDDNSGTYDMGFRNYDPGLNRFTTRDMYNRALSDMSLGSDPFTGNRYAFTGGNPISNVEIDGHFFGLALALPALAIPGVGEVLAAVAIVAAVVVVAYVATKAISAAMDDTDTSSDTDTADEPDPKPTPKPTPKPIPTRDKKDNKG